ncbi:hypothetical protein [Thermococcus paralvinellae]|uniref:Uncharacterized protein n=1 Tax=Thermococcus paralvinellae TaxID=582419 RepID=W0I0G9_9EURY|nr:hypothetical protein [Thermococcus paralvinellae]AHF79546.1 Hypothetical protein TES1_0149 [Thermococcus paralvinellae]
MRLLRFGPSILFLRTSDIKKTEEQISKIFGVSKTSTNEALRKSGEFETILFITGIEEKKTIPHENAFLVKKRAPLVLKEILNRDVFVERVDIECAILLMRIPKNLENALKVISEKYNGRIVSFEKGLVEGEEEDTLLVLTDKKLSSPIELKDIRGSILVSAKFLEFYRDLVIDLPILLNKILPDWNEITIKLYDTAKRYEQHIERLLLVIEDLDLGFIVSEGWDWDYPRPFMRVPIYKLKLLTWEDPMRVKFLLKGLEYREYTRLVDIDVFVENKKISWTKVAKGFDSKFKLAKVAREELEKLLSDEAKKRLYSIETKLLQGETLQQR